MKDERSIDVRRVGKVEKYKMKEDKGVVKMEKERKEERMEERKEVKQLVKEIENKRLLLVETVFKWAQGLSPMKNVHIKIKGRFYPLIEKETGKVCLIDKVQSRKIPFETLESSMQFITACTLAERKEEIEKEVEEGKRKYLEGKLNEIENLLNKF